ncbi:4-hydroxy-3-methylbut-2-en-1-yl diphosphate synthase [Aedoeadaptatus ivorii]|uniref:4-hydroxy-3-methylbut-2-en-1-yl diphosphate synthase (flavodoxin) n=1 Tax=Aedoeadaptatus ivorii TaxID=54006 RepID=A0A3S4YKT2_9FIRM|nr:flavodoxin-dependent (E)-4-hydroxy-3-methylbut-2-enyl-diphosphate synthase [Peptoniphilus ivorii]MDQ0507808.1 (E)-4-hydroxy-3-methylbut-2-enyl-diphosphate synthase [Peptoniphilus ivorii]VEJ35635.1 4-hydroxy-3-methylbut-2-en-1-yl diphosphate synthase [Peptoniphilus ivorii]
MAENTRQIMVGDVAVGGGAPISIQSMTNTKTKDTDSTVRQIHRLEAVGCDIVRVAVNDADDAKALPKIRSAISIPVIADIQFDYKLALYAVEHGVDGLRINPGNIGEDWKIREVAEAAKAQGLSIRVGVNSGSVKRAFIDKFGGVNPDSIVGSALEETEMLEKFGFRDIKVSLKSSDVHQSVESYRKFAALTDYPLHLGITEAGAGERGIVKSAMGLGILLYEGIGDTMRVSLTGDPTDEVQTAKLILSGLGLRTDGIEIVSCPTCGRTEIDLIGIVKEAEERFKDLDFQGKIAIMGCRVNGPGEAQEADYGICGGNGRGVIFKKGKVIRSVSESELLDGLIECIERDRLEK